MRGAFPQIRYGEMGRTAKRGLLKKGAKDEQEEMLISRAVIRPVYGI